MNCMLSTWYIEFRLYDKQLAHVYLLNLSLCLSSHTQCSWQRLNNNYMLSIHSPAITLQLVTKVMSHDFHATDDQRIIYITMVIQENFVTSLLRHWWSKWTIYGCSGKLCRMLSMTLTIQQPYMAIEENFATCFLWYWQSNDHIR